MLLDGEKESLKLIFQNIQLHQVPDILEILADQIKSKSIKFDKILKQTAKQIREQEQS